MPTEEKEQELKEKFMDYIKKHNVVDLLTELLTKCAESGISPKKRFTELFNPEVPIAHGSRSNQQEEQTSQEKNGSGDIQQEVKQLGARIEEQIKKLLQQKEGDRHRCTDRKLNGNIHKVQVEIVYTCKCSQDAPKVSQQL